ncbi:MAG: starch synthase, partial [Pseudomonadota bacterium]|nr:starch synthase [Pseudomonadota bacterium]
ANNTATGFMFNEASEGALLEAIKRATILYSFPDIWHQIQVNAMSGDFSWKSSAEQYVDVYSKI